MSFMALAWASKYRADSAAMKLVLLAFADRHNEETGCAYPSIAWLCEFSSLNRKTVIAAIDKLEAVGILTDTGERAGGTRQVKVYRLTMAKSAENGTVPKTEQYQKRNGSENGGEESQKRDTDTVRNQASPEASPPTKARAGKLKAAHVRLPDDWKPIRFADATVAREVIDRRGIEWGRAALESFRNWAANADDKAGIGRKLNWQAAWANWVIEQDRRDGRNGSGNRQHSVQPSGIGRTAEAALDVFGPG